MVEIIDKYIIVAKENVTLFDMNNEYYLKKIKIVLKNIYIFGNLRKRNLFIERYGG